MMIFKVNYTVESSDTFEYREIIVGGLDSQAEVLQYLRMTNNYKDIEITKCEEVKCKFVILEDNEYRRMIKIGADNSLMQKGGL
jgi:hypothetical protein